MILILTSVFVESGEIEELAFNPRLVEHMRPRYDKDKNWLATEVRLRGGQTFLSDRSIEDLCEEADITLINAIDYSSVTHDQPV